MGIRHLLLKIAASILSRDYRRFLKAAESPRKEQGRILAEILKKNEESRFGKDHGFGKINSLKEFRARIPITDYDFLKEYIEREMKGEEGQLTSSPVIMFATTSGTTSASKFIPVTKDYTSSYKRGAGIWAISAFRKHPEIAGKVLTIASARTEGLTECGIPYGAISGLMHDEQSRLTKLHYVSSPEMFAIADYDEKCYVFARVALEYRLSHINTANPSTILKLCKTIEDNKEMLIRDIFNGTLSRGNLKRRFRRNPRRARELENLIHNEKFRPEFFWPEMALIGCWKGGTQNLFLEQFPKYFGNTPIRDIGLLASEGRMSVPLKDEGSSGVLYIPGMFFEFIPEEQIDERNPEILLTDELKQGENYFVLITNQSGLYRYDIRDLVHVTGYTGRTPEISFLNKGKHISNIAGEKLSEFQIIEAYKKARIEGMKEEFVVYPRMINGAPELVFASMTEIPEDFLDRFDSALRELNIEYDCKRKTGRLSAVSGKQVKKEEFEAKRKMIPGKEAQYKHVYLRGIGFFE